MIHRPGSRRRPARAPSAPGHHGVTPGGNGSAVSLLPLDDAPGRLPAAVPLSSPIRFGTPRLLRTALVLLPLLLIGAWAAVDWRTVYDGTARLGSADPWWLL